MCSASAVEHLVVIPNAQVVDLQEAYVREASLLLSFPGLQQLCLSEFGMLKLPSANCEASSERQYVWNHSSCAGSAKIGT